MTSTIALIEPDATLQFLGWVADSYREHAKISDNLQVQEGYEGSAEMADEHATALRSYLTNLLQRCEKAEAAPKVELTDGTYVPLASLIHAQHQVKELTRERDMAYNAIGSNRFLDPPDGGSVTLDEQVSRMRQALELAEHQRDEAMKALEPFAKMADFMSDEFESEAAVNVTLADSNMGLGVKINFGDLRAARNAMGEKPENNSGDKPHG